jgi:hypothetical protein
MRVSGSRTAARRANGFFMGLINSSWRPVTLLVADRKIGSMKEAGICDPVRQ